MEDFPCKRITILSHLGYIERVWLYWVVSVGRLCMHLEISGKQTAYVHITVPQPQL